MLVVLGGDEEDNRRYCGRLEKVGKTDCGYCRPYENHVPAWICRDLTRPLEEAWPELKRFI